MVGYVDEFETIQHNEFKRYKEIAEKALDSRDYPRAASAFLKAGRAMERLARITQNENLREKRSILARNYIETGEGLKEGIIPTKSEPKEYRSREVDSKRADTESEEGGFEKYIEENLITTSSIKWDDIGGLDSVKETIKESVVLSLIEERPEAIKPWKGILLFGPPGTGKTLMAAATAGSLKAAFLNVKISQILSKYFGESPKLITALYNVGRKRAPSIIFLDEFDSIALSRSGEVSEASRRVLSTLLSELDGLENKDSRSYVLTMAATNAPWDVDNAVLSRFPKRIHIPLPDKEACRAIIKLHTTRKGLEVDEGVLERVAERCTANLFGGRDIETLCNKVAWDMVRSENPALKNLIEKPEDVIKSYKLKVNRLSAENFDRAFESTEGAVKEGDIEKYQRWTNEYGSI